MTKLLHICGLGAALLAAPVAAFAQDAAEANFSKGFFIVNEGQWGTPGLVNYIDTDNSAEPWQYRVYQEQNPGSVLGQTAQFGTVYNGVFYIVCKQAKAPSSEVDGGLLVAADPKTMKRLWQIDEMAAGVTAEGRSFIGVTPAKGYLSTSNGVWVIDLEKHSVTGVISGTESANPSDPYNNQCGSMELVGNHVFVANQSKGLQVIDTATDAIVSTVSFSAIAPEGGIGSVVKAKDGSLWCSIYVDSNCTAANSMLRVDPATLDTELVAIADGYFGPANTWFTWTPDGFSADPTANALVWNGGSSSWYSNELLYRFDIDTRTTTLLVDLSKLAGGWKLYGCSMRIQPESGLLYASLFKDYASMDYTLRAFDNKGQQVADYPMVQNYWFPSIPVYPQLDPMAGIESLAADVAVKATISLANGSIVVANAAGAVAEVYTVSGQLVATRAIVSDAVTALDVDLPAGLYIVRVGGATAKIRL